MNKKIITGVIILGALGLIGFILSKTKQATKPKQPLLLKIMQQ